MAKHDHLMDDPRFAAILFKIESRILAADDEARKAGHCLPKDSAVKSALRKAELALDGKKPANAPKDELEVWIAGLSKSLVGIFREMEKTGEANKGEFRTTLGAARGSLDTRREMAGTPRGYLDFLEGFVRMAGE